MGWIKRAWRGEERLWKVFWIYGMLLGIGVGIVLDAVSKLGTAASLVSGAANIIYLIWLTVSEWRCAFNVQWKFWGYFIRGAIALLIVSIPLGLLVGGVLVGQDLIKAAECRKQTQEYLAKGGADAETFKKECHERQKNSFSTMQQYSKLCTDSMISYAHQNNLDSERYLADNQAYLQQCIQNYMHNAPTNQQLP